MMKPWGHTLVSSAHEVYLVLIAPPFDSRQQEQWRELLCIEPPIWGALQARDAAATLAAQGLRLWSWDDFAVVLSEPSAQPPVGLRYCPWTQLERGLHPSQFLSPEPPAP
jgi:hypothetical protein